MRIRNVLAAAMLAGASFAASAGDLSYTWLEGGYVRSDRDALDSGNGFGVRGSGAITENLHFFGGYERTDQDDVDLANWRAGVGYNLAVGDDVDLIARVSYERADYDFLGDGDGFGVEVGVRAAFGPAWEASAGLRYADLDLDGEVVCAAVVPTPPACQFVADEDGGNTAFFVGGQYKFNPQWGVVAEASFSSNDNRVFVGPRISF
jgi:Ax21 family sulfation-dependent quorum factor